MNKVLLWALLGLVNILVCIQLERKIEHKKPEECNPNDWCCFMVMALVPPLGWLLIIVIYLGPTLVKERYINKTFKDKI